MGVATKNAPLLEEKGIPHLTQSAYQAGVSCADPTEAVQEAVRSHIQHGSSVYQCFYDLEKAFDLVEYSILLAHLFKAGINGKGWRLVKSFYSNPRCGVRVNGQLTNVQRGVRQGSVLSPMLFLIVMDSLLVELAMPTAGSPYMTSTLAPSDMQMISGVWLQIFYPSSSRHPL